MGIAMNRTRAVLLAGGLGSRMGKLTERNIKPMALFAGQCRLVDFSIRNARDSGLDEVLVLSHYREKELIHYLKATWEDAHFTVNFGPHEARLRAGVPIEDLPPRPAESGTADALLKNREDIFDAQYDDILLMHADHVYTFDYNDMLRHHRACGSALTIACQAIPYEYVSLFGMLVLNAQGELVEFVEKPAHPTSNLVFAAFCIFDRRLLAQYLDDLSREGHWQSDISKDVIPAMLTRGEKISTYTVQGYWSDIGTEARYLTEQLMVLDDAPLLPLRDIPLTYRPDLAREYVRQAPGLVTSLVSADLRNEGSIEHSIVAPDVHVGAGAHVRNCILLPGARVAPGAHLSDTVLFS